MPGVSDITLRRLTSLAMRHATVRHEAEDIVQDVLLAAIAQGRNLADPNFMAWAAGAVRLHSRFLARTATRRRHRESAYVSLGRQGTPGPIRHLPQDFVDSLPPSRRIVALLVNLGMGRLEIAYLLGLTDTALRQRLTGIRKQIAAHGIRPDMVAELHGGGRSGLARRQLKAALPPGPSRQFAFRDPDGAPIFISADHVSGTGGNKECRVEPRPGSRRPE